MYAYFATFRSALAPSFASLGLGGPSHLDFRASVLLFSDEALVFPAGIGQEVRCQERGRDQIRKSDADPHQCAGECLVS